MPGFTPPAQQEQLAPSSPTQGVVIGSSDQFSFDYIIGKVIIGGGQFADTLGRFSPIVIDSTGLKVNASDTTPGAIRFHNTSVSIVDQLIYLTNADALAIAPNRTSSTNAPVIIADRTGTFIGWQFAPAYVSGTTHPAIIVNDPPGTATVTMFNEVWYGFQFITNYYAEYLIVSGAPTTNTPYIQAAGTDPNIGVQILGKGTGVIYFDTQFANYLYAWGSSAGNPPEYGVIGSDANIDLGLRPKGTGVVRFLYATNALGGGAAPTLGTIGGTGPTTAGQNSWLKVNANGTVYWVPVWT